MPGNQTVWKTSIRRMREFFCQQGKSFSLTEEKVFPGKKKKSGEITNEMNREKGRKELCTMGVFIIY
jgi:hypothetical protein